jgi:hypothetical protein
MSEVREFAVEHNPRGCSEPSTRVHIRGGTCAQMLEFSPAVVQRGSRLASTVRPLTTLCGGHVTRTDTVVPSPTPAVRRARPRGSARRARRVGYRNSRAGTPVARPARARDPTALANTRPTRRRVRADPPAGSAGAHADMREHTVHQGASKAARAARQAGAAAGPRAAPAPAATSALCARARALRPPRRGHARGPRPLASETKKRRKTRLIVRRPSGTGRRPSPRVPDIHSFQKSPVMEPQVKRQTWLVFIRAGGWPRDGTGGRYDSVTWRRQRAQWPP